MVISYRIYLHFTIYFEGGMDMNQSDKLDQNPELLKLELQRAEKMLADQQQKNAKLAAELQIMTSKYNELSNDHAQVIASSSWRMTAPFRKVALALKRCRFTFLIGKAFKLLLTRGPKALFSRLFAKRRVSKHVASFTISKERRAAEEGTAFPEDITISVLVPLYNTPLNFLEEMIRSVQHQTYPKWELCLADGSDADHADVEKTVRAMMAKDSRIVYRKLEKNLGISDNTNACIDIATGDYIALFDHDDLLHPSALFRVMQSICEQHADFIYTDEVTFLKNNTNNLVNAHFKSDFAPDTLRSYNYICHLSVFSRELLDKVGYFRKEYDGSQDYDLILRLTEQANTIVHIPEILYFWRGHKNSTAQDIGAKPYIIQSAHKALDAHLERCGLSGKTDDSSLISTYRIRYNIQGQPLVSIIIANKDHIDVLDVCIRSIYEKTTYPNFEIVIVENNSTEESTFRYYEQLQKSYDNLRIVVWKDKFNYSAINNFGFEEIRGEYALLLNNDIEVITNGWIEEMLMYAQRKDVGAVGAMLYYPDDTIQHAGVIVGLGGVAGHSHKNFPRDSFGYIGRASIAQNLSAVTFACVMIRADVFREVNGLDESFEVAFNDVDMCMRIRKAGYLIVFTPYAELYHHESKSRGAEDTPEKVKRFNSEIQRFRDRWSQELKDGDPYYNPNLTLDREDFSFKD